MQTFDFTELNTFLLTLLFTFLGIFFRYVLIALVFDGVFYGIYSNRLIHKKISLKPRKRLLIYKEIYWSAITSVIFAFSTVCMLIAWQKGFTMVYTDTAAYPLWYLVLSVSIFLMVHETYYYWLHRWMHHPKVFKWIHKVHHESVTPSVWTAFSFHPFEGILQALLLPLFLFFVPMHYSAIIFLLIFMTVSSFINHLNIEIYPNKLLKNRIGKWLIGATHHTLHHTEFKTNYGLYFTFWDHWMKTESPNYQKFLKRLNRIRRLKSTDRREKAA